MNKGALTTELPSRFNWGINNSHKASRRPPTVGDLVICALAVELSHGKRLKYISRRARYEYKYTNRYLETQAEILGHTTKHAIKGSFKGS